MQYLIWGAEIMSIPDKTMQGKRLASQRLRLDMQLAPRHTVDIDMPLPFGPS
jgi:hypothetical protein